MALRLSTSVCLLAFAASVSTASAQTASEDLSVTLEVASECSVTTTAVAFSGYTGTANSDAAGEINVTCTDGASYSVTLAATSGGSGTRTLTSGSDTLNYSLYSDSGRSTLFPESSGEARNGTGASQTIPVYGRVASGQAVKVGSYSDTVTVTVTY